MTNITILKLCVSKFLAHFIIISNLSTAFKMLSLVIVLRETIKQKRLKACIFLDKRSWIQHTGIHLRALKDSN